MKISNTSDIRVSQIESLDPPITYLRRQPISNKISEVVIKGRNEIENIIKGNDKRLLFIVGPCSIHDETAGLEYASRLSEIAKIVSKEILVVMRVYFEKPRTTVGWKGLINDPNLDGSFDISNGLKRSREFLLKVNELGIPVATEFLDPFIPQYLADLVSWGAIGARTSESQTHREMASGLSVPVGFKNGTGGSYQIAIDAIISASSPHTFLGIDLDGNASIVHTKGNEACHLVLRGGSNGPNYEEKSVKEAENKMIKSGLDPKIIIDCSHANSNKDHKKQPMVFENILSQKLNGNKSIVGLMLESHINEGNQSLSDPNNLKYGVSITDACINWETTKNLIINAQKKLKK